MDLKDLMGSPNKGEKKQEDYTLNARDKKQISSILNKIDKRLTSIEKNNTSNEDFKKQIINNLDEFHVALSHNVREELKPQQIEKSIKIVLNKFQDEINQYKADNQTLNRQNKQYLKDYQKLEEVSASKEQSAIKARTDKTKAENDLQTLRLQYEQIKTQLDSQENQYSKYQNILELANSDATAKEHIKRILEILIMMDDFSAVSDPSDPIINHKFEVHLAGMIGRLIVKCGIKEDGLYKDLIKKANEKLEYYSILEPQPIYGSSMCSVNDNLEKTLKGNTTASMAIREYITLTVQNNKYPEVIVKAIVDAS